MKCSPTCSRARNPQLSRDQQELEDQNSQRRGIRLIILITNIIVFISIVVNIIWIVIKRDHGQDPRIGMKRTFFILPKEFRK